jgi:dienelactone hydrolase
MLFREEKEASKTYKQNYLDGIKALLSVRQKAAEQVRAEYIKDVFKDAEKYRNDFKKMLGFPLVDFVYDGAPNVRSTKLADEENYEIFRMEIEISDDLWMCGLFFKMKGEEKKPLVLVSHGGLGTPELISGIYGDTSNYNDILPRVIKYGVHAFAPQLLLWHDDYEVPFDRKELDADLKRVGSSITALEVFGFTRILDYFEDKPYVKNFGMVGLSYGGFYTLFTTAVDTRIKSAISCSFFNDRDMVGWSDWVWQNSAYKFNDAEVAALCYPRRLCIQMGDKDQLFDAEYTKKSFDRLRDISKDVGADWLDLIIFDGNHEFCKDDAPIIRLVNDLK